MSRFVRKPLDVNNAQVPTRLVIRRPDPPTVVGVVWLEGETVRYDDGAKRIVEMSPLQGLTPDDGPEFMQALWESVSGTSIYTTAELEDGSSSIPSGP